jgi:hypothetical protein
MKPNNSVFLHQRKCRNKLPELWFLGGRAGSLVQVLGLSFLKASGLFPSIPAAWVHLGDKESFTLAFSGNSFGTSSLSDRKFRDLYFPKGQIYTRVHHLFHRR